MARERGRERGEGLWSSEHVQVRIEALPEPPRDGPVQLDHRPIFMIILRS